MIIKIYDYPDQIRKHLNPIPLLGGPQLIFNIYILYFANYYLNFTDKDFQFDHLLIFSTLVFLLGFFDDNDINVTLKFISLMTIILFLLLLNEKLLIRNLYFETGNLILYCKILSIFYSFMFFIISECL